MNDKLYDVAIVGAGSAGLHAAFVLASQGRLNVVVLDQGDAYESRILSNAQGRGDLLRGIGGAGTLSGGKLCGIPACMELWRKTWYALPKFNRFLNSSPFPQSVKEALTPSKFIFADKSSDIFQGIVSKNYPSALLLKKDMQAFIRDLYDMAKLAGCSIKTQQTITGLRPGVDHFTLEIQNGNRDRVFSKSVIIATGRSSAKTIGHLLSRTRARVIPQAPDLGIRMIIPHAASDIFVDYGKDIKLKQKISDTIARTFCVCTGGDSAVIDLDDVAYIDGHFTDHLTKNVNAGIVARRSKFVGYQVAIQFAKHVGKILAGKNMTIQEFISHQNRLAQEVAHGVFHDHILSIRILLDNLIQIGAITGQLNQCEVVGATIDRYWPRVQTNQCFETHQDGLYVIGDCSGISRGYIQAMWSGQCAAFEIIKRTHSFQHDSYIANEQKRTQSINGELRGIAA